MRPFACTLVLVVAATAALAAEPRRLTIERLYSLPRIIGTAPGGFAWSADDRYLGFLWNNEGRNFRDVWIVDTRDPELTPQRLTTLPHQQVSREDDPVLAANSAERLERDPGAVSLAWHPDGRQLLTGFRGDLWLVAKGAEPRNLTNSDAAESQATFSPDGNLIAFLRQGDLWTLDMSDGAETRLSKTEAEDVRLSSFLWAPDGASLAVMESDRSGVPLRAIPDYLTEEPVLQQLRRAYPGDEPTRQRLGTVATLGGEIDWIDLDEVAPDMLLSYRWAPDSSRLAVDTSDLYAKDRRVYVVDVEDRSSSVVAADRDDQNETFYFWRIEWSTDGQLLYFLSDRSDDYHVWAVSPEEAGTARQLTSGAWAVAGMHPVEGGLIVVGNRDDPEQRHLFRVSNGGGEAVRLSHRPGTHSPSVSPNGSFAAVVFSNDATPPELLLTSIGSIEGRDSADGGRDLIEIERVVTDSPIPEFHAYRWVTPRYVTFPSHIDGTILHGRLTLPPDFDPKRSYPAILGSIYTDSVRNQWGGRTAHPTWGLDQFLAQEGYILLNVDMRGSWGRGREHRRGIRLDYGGMDIEDLESGVRYLATLGHVDMDRVGIWGSSYGGLMTAMSLFRKPGLYAAGIAGAPATNVWHALTGQMAVMMRPEDQPDEYADSSPFMHADGLEDPLMIVHGMRDQVVLFKDSVTLVQRLITLGKDVELVALPDAGHGWDNEGLTQTRYAFGRMVDFFARHLGEPCGNCEVVGDETTD